MPANTPVSSVPPGQTIKFLDNITFAGSLIGYNKYSFGKEVVSWCLQFNDATFMPDCIKMLSSRELWVPMGDVAEIENL